MTTDTLLSLLQFSDGLFPAGAYAHSFGLEYYVQSGRVSDAEGVGEFIRANLEGSAGTTDVIVMLAALRSASRNCDLDTLTSLDAMMDAMKVAEELRSASRQMGRQTLRIAAALAECELLKTYFQAVDSDVTSGHHAVCFGAIAGNQQWSEHAAATAYLYSAASAIVGSALRLLPLGQLRGQQLVWQMREVIARLVNEAVTKTTADLWSFVPALEIASMQHAQLDARLFRS